MSLPTLLIVFLSDVRTCTIFIRYTVVALLGRHFILGKLQAKDTGLFLEALVWVSDESNEHLLSTFIIYTYTTLVCRFSWPKVECHLVWCQLTGL